MGEQNDNEIDVFRISPLIRLTLLILYIALTFPLPFLAEATDAPVPSVALWIGLGLGAIALTGVLSERVVLDPIGITVSYAPWISWLLRRGWTLPWAEVVALKPRSTGQGGLVYYFLSKAGEGFLLPMRVVGFNQLVQRVQKQTGIDTRGVIPLAQPWMYLILLGFSGLLLLVDLWVVLVALGPGAPV
ncbi:MAG: hypothetical protein ACFCA4_14565 [Cyanophyceae cyanobacterium]